jgi:hypothetical protein
MQNLNFYIIPFGSSTQVLIPNPDNWQELLLELSYENDAPETVLDSTKLIFKGANAAIMDQWLESGLSGGPSIFVGIPLQIQVCNSNDVVFDGIIDLTDPDTKFTCDIVTVKIRDWRVDMVTEEFSSVTYAYLAAPVSLGGAGVINPTPTTSGGDYVVIPYQRNDVPDGIEFVTTGLAIYSIMNLLENAFDTLTGLVGGVAAAVAAGAGILSTAAVALDILELIFEMAYFAFLILCIVDLLELMAGYLVAPVLTKFGMYARTLLQKACDYFGVGFSSSILNDPSSPYYDTVIMPEKSAWVTNQTMARSLMLSAGGAGSTSQQRMLYDDLYNSNHPFTSHAGEQCLSAYGYYDGTPTDLIKALEKVFNAKAKIILNGAGATPVLNFERWDYQYNSPLFTLPQISDQAPFNSKGPFNTTGQSTSAFGTNASELSASYFIKYAMDQTDLNTYNFYEGTSCMATTQLTPTSTYYTTPTGTAFPSSNYAILLRNLTDIELDFSQAMRKDKLTAVEEALLPIFLVAHTLINVIIAIPNAVISAINTVTSLVGIPGIPTIPNPIPSSPNFAHTGHLLLSQDTTGQPKIFVVNQAPTTYAPYTSSSDWNSYMNFTGFQINLFNKGLLGARYLMRNFHWSSLPISTVPTQIYSVDIPPSISGMGYIYLPVLWTSNLPNSLGSANQYPAPGSVYFNEWVKYQDQLVPVCCGDFQKIQNNNCMLTYDGKTAKVDSIKWNVFKGLANMDYRVQQVYAKNIQVTFIVDGQTFVQNGSL